MNTPFAIIGLTAEMMKRVVKGIREPHCHEFEEVIIVAEGNPYHVPDAKKINLSPPIAVLSLFPGALLKMTIQRRQPAQIQ